MAWRFKFPYNLIQSNATVRTFIRKKATSFSINCGLFFITCHFLDISPVRFPLSICALFWAAWLHWCTNHFLNATYWVNVVIVNHDSLETGLLDQALKSLFRFHPIGLRSFAVSAGNLCFHQLFLLSLFFFTAFLTCRSLTGEQARTYIHSAPFYPDHADICLLRATVRITLT